jgi:hypothetical protein
VGVATGGIGVGLALTSAPGFDVAVGVAGLTIRGGAGTGLGVAVAGVSSAASSASRLSFASGVSKVERRNSTTAPMITTAATNLSTISPPLAFTIGYGDIIASLPGNKYPHQ